MCLCVGGRGCASQIDMFAMTTEANLDSLARNTAFAAAGRFVAFFAAWPAPLYLWHSPPLISQTPSCAVQTVIFEPAI